MKYCLIVLCVMMLVFLSQGCLSQIVSTADYTKNMIGIPIEKLKEAVARPGSYPSRISWQETTYKLKNGNWVYVEPVKKGCLIHWKVNSKGTIIGYKIEGNSCP